MRVYKPKFRDRDTGEQRETQKWYVDFKDHLDVRHRIPTERCRTQEQAEKFGKMVEGLVTAKMYGDQFSPELRAWLHGQPKSTLRKLVEIGVVDGEIAAATIPMEKHIKDFESWLKTTRARHGFKRNQTYISVTLSQLRRIINGCGFVFWNDIKKEAVATFLDSLGLGSKSYNSYLLVIKTFCRWMIDQERASVSPVEKIKRVKWVKNESRRALTFEEMVKLLTATVKEPVRYGMTGLDRAMVYILAAETGYRANEIAQLTVGCFDFANACVVQSAQYCKNRQEATQYIKRKRVEQFRAYFAGRSPDEKAFAMPSSIYTAAMIRADLKAAGIEAVVHTGTKPVKIVFHSLRHTLGTALDRCGATDKERHVIGRWSDKADLSLGTYGHLRIHELRAVVERLPDYPWPGDILAQDDTQAEKVA